MKKPKVFVGVSGGVDSSVALALLQKQGYDVTGVFLKVWHPDFLPCDWREERRSAMRVCATLGVPFLTLDCEAEYKKEVADYMINEYKMGRTPNPDIFCNKYVKFGVFLKKALEMGADYIATGHYAVVKNQSSLSGNVLAEHRAGRRSEREEIRQQANILFPTKFSPKKNSEPFQLHESVDDNKDQSYFLYTLNQEQLSHVLFPVGDMTKPQVRKCAEEFGLPTATKKDSQGVCFLGELDMKEFLSHYIESKKGDVLNTNGEVIGTHNGAIFSTIGERHGFTITKKTPHDGRYFVIAKDIEKNTITVAEKKSEPEKVFSITEIVVPHLHFIGAEPALPYVTSARIRYRQEKQTCMLTQQDDGYHIVFHTPQNGIAVGQSAVLYDGTHCLGGGIIEKVL
ncbi:MAG: tRNA-uridine 2-sulfurtransferase [Patescibacteria group bacterium]|nr:tRNA-uridine 2-sulfurtransferase [Patescibacteria group bacterium]